jgi:glutamate dehydrogenase/leucine dehydrogenase
VWGTTSLAGRRVSLQGVGACGAAALAELVAEDAVVTVCDVDPDRARRAAERHGVAVVAPEAIWSVPADIAAPFALGGAVDLAAVASLQRAGVRVLAGSANNVLASRGPGDDAVEQALVEAGICWAVDFVANAGGCIADADRFRPGGHDPARVAERLAAIGPRTHAVLDAAVRDGVLPSAAATALARARLVAAGGGR